MASTTRTIGIKPETKQRFDEISEGFKHDAFVNLLLDLYQGTTLIQRAQILESAQVQRARLLQAGRN